MSEAGDLELNLTTTEASTRQSSASNKKHSKSFKKLAKQKQLDRKGGQRRPKTFNSTQGPASAAAALKGYALGPVPGQQERPHKRAEVADTPAAGGRSTDVQSTIPAISSSAAAENRAAEAAKKPTVFGGEAKALAELLQNHDSLHEDQPFQTVTMDDDADDSTDYIMAAVQASQIRDRNFSIGQRTQTITDYDSDEETKSQDDAGGVRQAVPAAAIRSQQPGASESIQHVGPSEPMSYKEGLAKSNAAKGPKLRPVGPSGVKSFSELGICEGLAKHLSDIGLPGPRQIQRAAIPAMLGRSDVVIQNMEASGKSWAHLIAIVNDLQGIEPRINREAGTLAIVMSPSAGTCTKVETSLQMLLKRYFWLVGDCMHGGEARNKEKARLRKGVTVLVSTPGRLLDHLQHTEAFRTAELRWLVLDDVDQIMQTDACKQLGSIFELLKERCSQSWQNVLVMKKRKLSDWGPLSGLNLQQMTLAHCREA